LDGHKTTYDLSVRADTIRLRDHCFRHLQKGYDASVFGSDFALEDALGCVLSHQCTVHYVATLKVYYSVGGVAQTAERHDSGNI
jgi:hypothetical protein